MADPEAVADAVDMTGMVTEVIPASVEEAGQLWLQLQDVVAAIASFVSGRWNALLVRRGVRRMRERAAV